jgi:two-component system chemotaxis response regulator CheB
VKNIRVLIVDDSIVVRRILSSALAGQPDIEVVGTARDAAEAWVRLPQLNPDVLTLDIDMPGMDGLTFLRKLMASRPMPVIVISSLGHAASGGAMDALAIGAVEVLAKPSGPFSVGEFHRDLAAKVRTAAAVNLRRRLVAESASSSARAVEGATIPRPSLIAIGASTGGTAALEQILGGLPADAPPVAVVQHIPAGFSRAFADRLSRFCKVRVMEAEDGQLLCNGEVAVAPGGRHMRLRGLAQRLRIAVAYGEPVCYQRPSVDVLFDSIAAAGIAGVLAIILTGMGEDGAAGLLHLKRTGARTIAQDETSSVVFGMPKEAIRRGGVDEVLSLGAITNRLALLPPAAGCAALTRAAPTFSPHFSR